MPASPAAKLHTAVSSPSRDLGPELGETTEAASPEATEKSEADESSEKLQETEKRVFQKLKEWEDLAAARFALWKWRKAPAPRMAFRKEIAV